MKKIFIQSWAVWDADTVVAVGMTNAEIVAFMREHADVEGSFPAIDEFEKHGRPNDDEGWYAFTYYASGRTVLCMSDWKEDVENLATLVHETNHLIYYVFRNKGMEEEPEAAAYTQAFLFREILQKLNDGVKSKRNKRKHER